MKISTYQSEVFFLGLLANLGLLFLVASGGWRGFSGGNIPDLFVEDVISFSRRDSHALLAELLCFLRAGGYNLL